jgi:hypothetical protein
MMVAGIKIINGDNGKKIVVRETSRFAKAFLIMLFNALMLHGSHSRNDIYITLIFCAPFIAIAVNVLFGTQTLSLHGNELTRTKRIGPFTIQQPMVLQTENIANIRLETIDLTFRKLPNIRYAIVCDYSGQRQALLELLEKKQIDILMGGPISSFLEKPGRHTINEPD